MYRLDLSIFVFCVTVVKQSKISQVAHLDSDVIMAAQVYFCSCGNTLEPLYKPGRGPPNGHEGIYFVVGQPSSPLKPQTTPKPAASEDVSGGWQRPLQGPPTNPHGAIPPPPPISNVGPPPPLPPPVDPFIDDTADGGWDGVMTALKGFFDATGKPKLRPSSERKIPPKPTIPTRKSRTRSSAGNPTAAVSPIGPGSAAGSPNTSSEMDHANLIAVAVNKRLPAFQGTDDPEDEEGDSANVDPDWAN